VLATRVHVSKQDADWKPRVVNAFLQTKARQYPNMGCNRETQAGGDLVTGAGGTGHDCRALGQRVPKY